MTKLDTPVFMTLGLLLMIASLLDAITQTMPHPFLTILVGATGLVTFWLPMIISSMDD